MSSSPNPTATTSPNLDLWLKGFIHATLQRDVANEGFNVLDLVDAVSRTQKFPKWDDWATKTKTTLIRRAIKGIYSDLIVDRVKGITIYRFNHNRTKREPTCPLRFA